MAEEFAGSSSKIKLVDQDGNVWVETTWHGIIPSVSPYLWISKYLSIYLPIYLSIYLSNTYYGLFNPEYITDWPRLFAISRWPLEPKEGSTAGSPRRFGRPHCALAQIAGGSPSKCLVGIFNWHFRNLNLLVGGLVAIFYFPIIWE